MRQASEAWYTGSFNAGLAAPTSYEVRRRTQSAIRSQHLGKRVIRSQIGIVSLFRPSLARSVIRPSALHMMHEHINHFTERSLASVTRSCGGAVSVRPLFYGLRRRKKYPGVVPGNDSLVLSLGQNARFPMGRYLLDAFHGLHQVR
ncbi:hypothetical protein SBA3_1780010 [Candidatus Sulfopaludibacter sp. SbA3]|nr:hypothetical protein SBA3_1780010 [Candidatus Sulfopaludibacter sp. SbA3]